MMKAKRGYKKMVDEKKAAKDLAKDMETKKTDAKLEAQLEEFDNFLRDALLKPKPFPFLVDMHEKLVIHGHTLSDNMEAALRKCMEREKQWAKEKEAKKDAPPQVITLKIKPFLMKDLGIDSRVITGTVKAESAKAWLIKGHADMVENMSWCARCGRQLTEPASQITGFGQICAEKIGKPYDPTGVLGASKKERNAVRKMFMKTLHNQKFERWIPKSQAEVLTDDMK